MGKPKRFDRVDKAIMGLGIFALLYMLAQIIRLAVRH